MFEGECCLVCEDLVYFFNNFVGCYVNGLIFVYGDWWWEDDCIFC